jgi:iron(III) transport system substrate-binding protein
VALVVPDQEPGGLGALLIPNTVAVLAEAPHPEAARRLVDWLLRPEIEAELARSRSAQIPVREGVPRPAHVLSGFRPMAVDFRAVGARIEARSRELAELFLE